MKTITKYGPITFGEDYPIKGTPLHAEMHGGGVCVWVSADDNDSEKLVRLLNDGDEYNGDHIATIIENPWVWHLVLLSEKTKKTTIPKTLKSQKRNSSDDIKTTMTDSIDKNYNGVA